MGKTLIEVGKSVVVGTVKRFVKLRVCEIVIMI